MADAAWLVELFHALALRLGSRAWIEWIDSESNPSDGLSRLGIHDPWTRQQGYSLRDVNADSFPQCQADIFAWAEICEHWGR